MTFLRKDSLNILNIHFVYERIFTLKWLARANLITVLLKDLKINKNIPI